MNWSEALTNLGERARGAALGFSEWKSRAQIHLTMLKVGWMRIQGRWADALTEMEAVVGISADDYCDPPIVLAKLRQRLEGFDSAGFALYLMQLTTFLVDVGKIEEASTLFETDAGIARSDYGIPALVSARLNSRLECTSRQIAFIYSVRLATLVGLDGRPIDELAVLESMMGIVGDDYLSSGLLADKLNARLVGVDSANRLSYLCLLVGALEKIGRFAECESIIYYLSKAGQEKGEIASASSSFARYFGDPFRVARIGYFWALADSHEVSFRLKALEQLEADLGITEECYQSPSLIAAAQLQYMKGLPPEFWALFVGKYLELLLSLNRKREALAFLTADVSLGRGDLQVAELIASRLRERCQRLPLNVAALYLATAACTLVKAGPAEVAATVMVIDANLATSDWSNFSETKSFLKTRLEGLEMASAVAYISALVSTLEAAGRSEEIALLVDAYLRGLSPLDVEEEGVELDIAFHLCNLYDIWLGSWGKDALRQPFELCMSIIPYLRRSLDQKGMTLRDRDEFIHSVSELRRRIVQTGLFWAEREVDPERKQQMHHRVQLWDIELTQRLLVERFLLTEIRRSLAGQRPASNRWPWQEEREISHYRPPKNTFLPVSDVALGELPAVPLLPPAASRGAHDSLRHERPDLYSRVQNRLRSGIDEEALAENLGPQGLLLRATFDAGGRLLWSALAGRGRRLEMVAHGAGIPGDMEFLRWTSAAHDFRVGYVRWLASMNNSPMLRPLGRDYLAAVVRDLADSLEVASPSEQRLDEIAGTFTARVEEMGKSGERIFHLFETLSRPLAGATSGGELAKALAALRAAELFLKEADTLVRQRPLRSVLDRITAGYLRQVATCWNLDPLASILTSEREVIVQVDDALHSVPVAWLPIRGRPLHRRVASVRSTLAPLMDDLQGEIERESETDAPRRMLSLSWLRPGDGAELGAKWFHQGQLWLAERFGYECLAGADGNGGSIGALRAALDEGGFATAAIYGHGDLEHAGIALGVDDPQGGGAALWQGDGCNLSSAEWLLLVSCSIGRVRQGGDLDVEGFCVQLAVHRARSVLACRWQVSAVEAAAFANEVVNQYLELRGKAASPAGLRGLALARARRRLAGGGDAPIGLNTAAAFELYGLG